MTSLSIAPIGTCRIHNPLRQGSGRYPIRPVFNRNYGYVHTSAEALQQLRFMLGAQDIPSDVRTLVFRPGMSEAFESKIDAKADLYMVEISSAKSLTVDGYPIQLNYTARHFADFFADKERARTFWSMATESRIAERREWLERDSAFQLLSREDRDLLARVLRRDMNNEEIGQDMQAITELVGKDKLVFVTHVNADTPDSMPIERRRRLINSVRKMAQGMNVPCYDPTPLMRKLGQANAMENSGLDLAHYTDLFSEQLCEVWYSSFVLPRIDVIDGQTKVVVESAQNEDSVDGLDAMWRAGRVLEASRRIHEILRADGSRQAYRHLLGRMQFELGDFEGAISQLAASRGDSGCDEKSDLLLMQCYFETGDYQQAGRLASALIADERETVDSLRICAISAEKLGDNDRALANWKRLFRISPETSEAATAAAQLLQKMGDAEGAMHWAREVRSTLPAHGKSFEVLWAALLDHEDRQGVLELAKERVDLPEEDILKLARRADDRGFATPAATLALTQGLVRSHDKGVAAWVVSRAAEWLETGVAALATNDLLQSADRIQACWQLKPSGNALIRARRALERKMRQEVRAALVSRNFQDATRILDVASQTLISFPDFDSFRIRVAEALGDTETALRYLRKPLHAGDDVSDGDWIRLARMAVRSGHFGEAIDAYSQVIAAKASDSSVREEAKRQVLGLRSRTIRLARENFAAGNHERAWSLLDRLQQLQPDDRDALQEKKRVLSALHTKVKSLDRAGDAERLLLGETILRLVPEDPIGLKAAATGAMRMHRFELALQYWQTLRNRSSSPELIDINIRKCRMWIDREQRVKAA